MLGNKCCSAVKVECEHLVPINGFERRHAIIKSGSTTARSTIDVKLANEASMTDSNGQRDQQPEQIALAESVPQQSSFELTFTEAKRLCEYSLDIVCVSNFSGKVLWSNNVDTVITGYTKEELANITWEEITHPEDVQKVSESLQVVSQGELRPCTEIRLRCKDGSYRWISWSGVPVIEENKIYSIGRDVTKQKEAEAEVKRLAAIVQSSNEAIFSVDERLCITSWNRGAEQLYGYRAEQVTGSSIAILLVDEGANSCLMDRTCSISHDVEELHRRNDGSHAEVSLSLFPIVDQFGVIEGTAAIVRDISKQKAAERCIAQFYSITSHELRTPLSSIRGVLGLLEGGLVSADSQEGHELINVALTSCDRLVRLINDILDARNSESGALELHYKPIEAAGLVSEAVASTALMARKSNIRVVCECNVDCTFEGDFDRLAQSLSNLLSNAIKFSPCDSTVRVTAKQQRDRVRFTVEDEGPGVPRHQKDNLFQRFRPLDRSDSRAKEGVGLGLSIAKSIVERHGGTIGVDCDRIGGGTFWFELPLVRGQKIKPLLDGNVQALD